MLEALVTALVGMGTTLTVTVGALIAGVVIVGKWLLSSSEAGRTIKKTLEGLRSDIVQQSEKQQEHAVEQQVMHAELKEGQARIHARIDVLTQRVILIGENVAKHDGVLSQIARR